MLRRYISRSETPSILHASEISGSGARWAVMLFGFAALALNCDRSGRSIVLITNQPKPAKRKVAPRSFR